MIKNKDYYVFAPRAWLSTGWHHRVLFKIENGFFTEIKVNATPPDNTLYLNGPVLPTIANVHSHAFQYLMAGMAEVSLNSNDSFWSWRDLMYRLVRKLNPEQVNIIATQLYIEMLKAGYTQVAEFHYLHHDKSGNTYADPAEMSRQLLAAAKGSGIGMTLLPVLYSYSGFGGLPPNPGQMRFVHSADSYLKLMEKIDKNLSSKTQKLGVCFHSLRAVSPEQMREILIQTDKKRPIHIHVAEQQKEVDDCLNWSGQRPVEWLDNNMGLDNRWCLVHATHLSNQEIKQIASRHSVIGLCPTTEANLGDGIFPGVDFEKAEGRWAIGSDSHVSLSIVDELRTLEYGQRLRDQQRNRLYRESQISIGDNLYSQALNGGNQACGINLGLKEGARADFMVLKENHPFIAASEDKDLLNRWLFACNENLINDVFVAGKQVIKDGYHEMENISRRAFIQVIKQVIY